MLAPTRFAADFMQAVDAARPARNPHAAQKAVGDVLLRYTSQARRCYVSSCSCIQVHTAWAGVCTQKQQPRDIVAVLIIFNVHGLCGSTHCCWVPAVERHAHIGTWLLAASKSCAQDMSRLACAERL